MSLKQSIKSIVNSEVKVFEVIISENVKDDEDERPARPKTRKSVMRKAYLIVKDLKDSPKRPEPRDS